MDFLSSGVAGLIALVSLFHVIFCTWHPLVERWQSREEEPWAPWER